MVGLSMTIISFYQLDPSFWTGDLWMTLEVKLWAFRNSRLFGSFLTGELREML